MSPSGSGKIFRVFVSSTFSDLIEERNALHKKTFPELRKLCMQYGFRFQAIDLRWGVSQEAALDQKSMEICLQELQRCQSLTPRPNFIILLGDRYGWRPLPYRVDAAEMEMIAQQVPPAVKDLLIWTDKQPDDQKGWYRRDDNAIPPEYILRPRRTLVPPEADSEQRQAIADKEAREWTRIESTLRAGIIEAINRLGWAKNGSRRAKYEASATHQEIIHGALGVCDAHEHVFCFNRKILGLPHDTTAGKYVDLDESGKRIDRHIHEALKSELKKILKDNFFEYEAQWQGGDISLEHIEQLCTDLKRSLSRIILSQITQLEEQSPSEREFAQHRRFLDERAELFVGREEIIQKVCGPQHVSRYPGLAKLLSAQASLFADEVSSRQMMDPHPLIVHGVSGSGKSALMARAIQLMQERNPKGEVIFRFIGVTPEASNSHSLLLNLCREIAERYGTPRTELTADYGELDTTFRQYLARATEQKPLTIFLDALDQLSDRGDAHSLAWLPVILPDYVRIIVSTLPGECLEFLEKRIPAGNFHELHAMSLDEGRQLLQAWQKKARRTLRPYQQKEILEKFSGEGNGLPLYLKLAFEESRGWRSYTDAAETKLPPDTPGIIRNLLRRLSLPTNHGELLVSQSLGYIAASKYGLAEDELLDVLSRNTEVIEDFMTRAFHRPPENRLPVILWSRLYLDLKQYLKEILVDDTTAIGFYHNQFREVVEELYLEGDAQKERHEALCSYFRSQIFQKDENDQIQPNLHALSELPYQQARGRFWEELRKTLTDLHFIETKICAKGCQSLLDDYREAYTSGSDSRDLQLVQGALRLCAHILSTDPHQIAGQLLGRLAAEEEPTVERLVQQAMEWNKGTWLRPKSPSLTRPGGPLVRILGKHRGRIIMTSLTQDAKRILSVSDDGVIKKWDVDSGAEMQAFDSKNSNVSFAAVSFDGSRLLLCSSSRGPVLKGEGTHFVKIWDVDREREIRTLSTEHGTINAAAMGPGNRSVVSGFDTGEIIVWDMETGEVLRIWRGHEKNMVGIFALPDGRHLLTVGENAIKMWDLETGGKTQHICISEKLTAPAALAPDGRRILLLSSQGPMNFWDLSAGKKVVTLEGHKGPVHSVALSTDGRRALSSGRDNTIRIWDMERGELVKTFREGMIENISIFPDCRHAVSSFTDSTIRIWDMGAEETTHAAVKTESQITALIAIPGTRTILSGHQDGTLTVWEPDSGVVIKSMGRHDEHITSVAVDHNARYAISGSADETAKIWKMDEARELITLRGHATRDAAQWVNAVAISPDSRLALTGSIDKTVKVWGFRAGTEIHTLKDHERWVISLAVVPDGSKAVSGSRDNTIKVWDLQTGQKIKTLLGHRGWVTDIAVLPDNKSIVSGSRDGTVRMWDLEKGTVRVMDGRRGAITSLAIVPNSPYLVAASEEKNVQLWDLHQETVLADLFVDASVADCAVFEDTLDIVVADDAGRVHLLHPECLPLSAKK